MNNQERRPYRMVARAAGVAATRERILDAAVAAFWAQPSDLPALDEVARQAGVTVPTVLRHFGSKDGLHAAAVSRETGRVAVERDPALVGDPKAAVVQLVDHYERIGDAVLRLLAEEARRPHLRELTETGRQFHREWCAQVFGAALAGRRGRDRTRLLAQLVAVCDVYTWKLLRRDAGLSRPQTEVALLELLEPLVKEA